MSWKSRAKQRNADIMSSKSIGVVWKVGARLRGGDWSPRTITPLWTKWVVRPHTSSRGIGTTLSSSSQHFFLRVQLFGLHFKLLHLCFTVLQLFFQFLDFCIIFSRDISYLIELLFHILSFLFGGNFLLSGQQPTYLFMEMVQLFFEVNMFLFLVGYIVFPINKIQVGSLNIFLQLPCPLDSWLNFDIDFFLLDLLLKARKLCL